MGFFQRLRDNFWAWMMPAELSDFMRDYLESMATRRDYRRGYHRLQFRVKPDQANDNVVVNFCELVIKRSISLLLGDGVDWDFGEDRDKESPEAQYIQRIYGANHEEVLFQRAAQYAAEAGTGYIKILPDGVEDESGTLPRLVAIDPMWVEIDTDPEDTETVLRYTIRYNTTGLDGKEVARKQVIERNLPFFDDNGVIVEAGDTWSIADYISGKSSQGRWELLRDIEEWPYPFAPIVHWQNLPDADSVYGESDITDDVIGLQDKANFVAANILRIIRYHGHPKTWGRGFINVNKVSWGPDEMVISNDPAAMLENLEMQSDLSSSQQFLNFLRQAIFDTTQTVDLSSVADKLGALTNFGLRVLYTDAISKLKIKRELLGDALTELNRRMLVMAGMNPQNAGRPVWHEVLPTNEQEAVEGYKFDLENKLVSRQTLSKLRGYDWADEVERIQEEAAGEDNIGAALLRAFNQGRE
jgi:hypothetical protein